MGVGVVGHLDLRTYMAAVAFTDFVMPNETELLNLFLTHLILSRFHPLRPTIGFV
jgi:hypothetical protein